MEDVPKKKPPLKGSRMIEVILHVQVNRIVTQKEFSKALVDLIRAHRIPNSKLLRSYLFPKRKVDFEVPE